MRTKITIAIIAVFVVGAIGIFAMNMRSVSSGNLSATGNPVTTGGGTSAGLETTNSSATGSQTPSVQSLPQTSPTTGTSASPAVKTYTLADVAKHSTQASCWTTINGDVYDVTSWIGQHPGGAQAIISLCGIDGSAAFNGQHGGQRRPATELASFYIGKLGTVSSAGASATGGSSGTASAPTTGAGASTPSSVTVPSRSANNNNDDD